MSFFLSCVYGDPVCERRQIVWDQLTQLGYNRDEAWLLIGDFNELMNNTEKFGGPLRRESTFWSFRNMANNCKIREVRSSGNMFSWSGWRDRVWIQCRLDRSFGNDAWFRLFPRSQLDYLKKWASDHRPIRLSFALENEEQNRGHFFFDKRMVWKEGFEEVVRKGGNYCADRGGSVMECISSCRKELAQWKKRSDFNSKDKIQRLQNAFENEVSSRFPDGARMLSLKQELAYAYREEEAFWRQRCQEQWLKEGDSNTPLFHNCVKERRIKNKVLMLIDNEGREQFSEGAKGHVAVEYYIDLFMSSNPADLESLFLNFPTRVTTDMNRFLTAPVSTEEIKAAAFSVKSSSAPGEDGLTGLFYQKCWHIVGPALTEEIQGFFRTSILPDGWNHTHISLLPKITSPTKMSDMRPISLCPVQYKIISKILCERLKRCLPELISETQGAFVSGRLISDNILIAHEMVHGLRTNDKVSKSCMAIKTDMSKAYDRVEWTFLEVLLERMGFDRIWVRWIMACVNSVSYSVLLNGQSHGFIRPERGIIQGDPLSPFLFILAAEALVNCLNNAEQAGKLHGTSVSTAGPSVHHLLFADDSLLLCQANESEASTIMDCLSLYGSASGQMINHAKSSIIFGSNVNETCKSNVKAVLGIDKEGGEGTYLGLPECFSGSKRKLLSFFQEKLQGRVNGWFAQALSHGGKEVLIKAVGLAMPIYAMSCFKLPKDVCKKITSVLTQFWWSRRNNKNKIPWVAWSKLCKDKESGGLGFHDIELFNQSLLGKQAFRIWDKPDSLLSRILKNRYFKQCSFLECGAGTKPSYAWRSILYGREILLKGLLKTIGDGRSTRVWTENWIMDTPTRPPSYRPDAIVDLTLLVSDLTDPTFGHWNVSMVRTLFTDDDATKILKMRLSRNRADHWSWGFTKDGLYTSKSAYKLLNELRDRALPTQVTLAPVEKALWKNLWKIKAPPKLRHFLWRALAGALAVKERLASRRLTSDTTCSLCGNGSESICHVLFNCQLAAETWAHSGLTLPPNGFSSSSVFLNLHYLIQCSRKQSLPEQVCRAFPWVLWQIWKARNGFIFERTRCDPRAIATKAKEDSDIWFNLTLYKDPTEINQTTISPVQSQWAKPAPGAIKCNVGAVWSNRDLISGASWITRDHLGKVLHHSRRSFSGVQSQLEAELLSLVWAAESMSSLKQNRVIFESSLSLAREAILNPNFSSSSHGLTAALSGYLQNIAVWSLDHTSESNNEAASRIARSVTQDPRKRKSYVARFGPAWLHSFLEVEASIP